MYIIPKESYSRYRQGGRIATDRPISKTEGEKDAAPVSVAESGGEVLMAGAKHLLLYACLGFAVFLLAPPIQASDFRALDGDTFLIVSTGERIRVYNLDTAEIHPCRCARECTLGHSAKQKAQELLDHGPVDIQRMRLDKYRRTIARVTIDGRDFGQTLIDAELARPYRGERRRSWCE